MTLPKPYVRPPAETSLEDREKMFAQKEVRHAWSQGYSADGVAIHPVNLAGYYQASGDSTTAKVALRTNVITQLGAILGLAGMSYGLGLGQGSAWAGDPNRVANTASNVVLASAGAVLLIELWARYIEYPRTARSYNRYLARDLSLEADPLEAAGSLPAPPLNRKARADPKAKIESPTDKPVAGGLKANGKVIPALPKVKRPFWAKSWYLDLIEVGGAAGSYPGTMEAKLDAAGALPGASTGRLELNVLGLYWPVGRKRDLLLGGMLDSTDHIVTQGNQSWSLERELYALSTMYFPFGKIGDNFFLRGDLGFVEANYAGQEFDRPQNGFGAGIKVGVGYAVPLGRFVRPLLNFDYGFQTIGYGDPGMDLGTYQGINLDLGVLW